MYSFRLRTTDGRNRSAYSAVVSINEPEGMLPGGGTPADTEVLRPAEGRLYRIICYASRYFNSGANINGPAQYLTAGSHNGHTTLNATTNFDWQDPALLWSITQDAADPTRYSIRTYSRNLCLAPVMTDEYITLDSTLWATTSRHSRAARSRWPSSASIRPTTKAFKCVAARPRSGSGAAARWCAPT